MSQTFPKILPASTNLRPRTSGVDTIGTADRPFSGTHVGYVNIKGTELSSSAPNTININGSFLPTTSGTYTIGSPSVPFKDMYVNNIIGTNLKPENILYVAKNAMSGSYTSIVDALDSITDASSSNPYLISVAPGIYTESEIIMKDWVSLHGDDIYSTIISPINSTQDIVVLSGLTGNVSISDLSLLGTITNQSAIHAIDNTSNFVIAHKISMSNTNVGVLNESVNSDNYLYLEYLDINAAYTYALKNTSSLGNTSFVNGENFYVYPDATAINNIYASGVGSSFNFLVCGLNGASGLINVRMTDGAFGVIQSCYMNNSASGIWIDANGAGTNLEVSDTIFSNCDMNVVCDNPNASGTLFSVFEYQKTRIIEEAQFHVENHDEHVISVAKKGGDFETVYSALNSISDNSTDHRYKIYINPGVYSEPTLAMKPYVALEGISPSQTIIQPLTANQYLISGTNNSAITNATLRNCSGVGYSAIYIKPESDVYFSTDKLNIYGNNIGVKIENDIYNVTAVINNATFTSTDTYTNLINVDTTSTGSSKLYFKNSLAYPSAYPFSGDFVGAGSGTNIYMMSSQLAGSVVVDSGTDGLSLSNGASAHINATTFTGYGKALRIENVGIASSIYGNGIDIEGGLIDISVEHPDGFGAINGTFDRLKLNIDPNSNVSLLGNDPTNKGTMMIGGLYQGSDYSHLTEIRDLIKHGGTMGAFEGGILSGTSNALSVDISEGYGYCETTAADPWVRKVEWSGQSISVSPSGAYYIYFNENAILTVNTSEPEFEHSVLLGRVITSASGIYAIQQSPMSGYHYGNRNSEFVKHVFGALFEDGCEVVPSGLYLDVNQGEYYYGGNKFLPVGGTPITFDSWYHSGTDFIYRAGDTTVDNANFDNGTELSGLSTGYYARHGLYLNGDGTDEKYFLVYGGAEYSGLSQAEAAGTVTPPATFSDSIVHIADIVVCEGSGSIITTIDQRPRPSFAVGAAGQTAITYHYQLLGLSSDDHSQYLLANGGRPLTGNLSLGGNSITNVNLVDGVDVSAHASRHLPNGLDPLTTTAPTANLSSTTTNSVGIQNSFARSDHSHAITTAGNVSTIGTVNSSGVSASLAKMDHVHAHGSQTDGTLHALSSAVLDGFMSSGNFTLLGQLVSVSGNYVNKSGDAMTGTLNAPVVSGTIISGNQIYRQGTEIDSLYVNTAGDSMTGTLNVPVLSGTTISGNNIYKNGTEINDIYVNVSGDTMTGNLVMNNPALIQVDRIQSNSSFASGTNSQAFGSNNLANGPDSHVEGDSNQALGNGSHAEGNLTKAIGNYSHAEGWRTSGVGYASHVEGSDNNAVGNSSHAEGEGNYVGAGGSNSHAEGTLNTLLASNSHIEGGQNYMGINATNSHVEGSQCSAWFDSTHAQGYQSIASGDTAFAAGYQAVVLHDASMVFSDFEGATSTATNQMTLGFNNGVVLRSGTSLLTSTSGINNIGSASVPFDTIYANNFYGVDLSSRVAKAGDTMTGDLIMQSPAKISGVSLDIEGNGISIINNSSSNIVMRSDKPFGGIQTKLGSGAFAGSYSIEVDGLGSIASFSAASSARRIEVSPDSFIFMRSETQVYPNTAGTVLIGTSAKPFSGVYANNIYRGGTEINSLYVNTAGDTMTGTLNVPVLSGTTISGNTINTTTLVLSGTTIEPAENNYAFSYDTTTQTVSVANTFQPITFDTNSEINGWTHTLSTENFVCGKSGRYLVNFTTQCEKTTGVNSTFEIRALFNGTEIAGSPTSQLITVNNLPLNIAGSFIMNAVTGQNLVFEMTGSTTATRIRGSNINSTSKPSISISISKLWN